MSVKGIFKTLLAGICIPVIFMLLVEYYTVSVAAPKIRGLAQITLRNSCDYFAQETYKTNGGNGYQLVGLNGVRPMSLNGVFYPGNADTTYTNLYKSSASFKEYIDRYRHYWRRLNLLGYGLGLGGSVSDSEKKLAQYYVDDKLTPLNLGVAYLDKDTLTKIFRWEYTLAMTQGKNTMITNGSDGDYVLYQGFRIYYDTIRITSINYKVYDLLNTVDAQEFNELTNIDVASYVSKAQISSSDERRYVMVAKLDISMRIGYEGVTPLKRLMQWAFARDANKFSDNSSSLYGRDTNSLNAVNGRNEDTITTTNNNFSSNGQYELQNELIYYIIR